MTREELIKSRAQGIKSNSSSYSIWTTDESMDITLEEHIQYNCPSMKNLVGNPYIFRKTVEKEGKTYKFLKVKYMTPGRVWEFDLSYDKDATKQFHEDDELDPTTIIFRKEICEEDGTLKEHDYITGEVME